MVPEGDGGDGSTSRRRKPVNSRPTFDQTIEHGPGGSSPGTGCRTPTGATMIRQISQPRPTRRSSGMQPEGQLDHPGALAAPQGDPHREGAGRGRPTGMYLYSAAETLGGDRAPTSTRQAHQRAAKKYSSIFNYPHADLRRRRRDRPGWWTARPSATGTAVPPPPTGPYGRAMVRILQGGVVPPAARAYELLLNHDARLGGAAGRWSRTRNRPRFWVARR